MLAQSRGDGSSGLSPVLLGAARWGTMGRARRRGTVLQTPTPGFVGDDSPLEACHPSAPSPEALESPHLFAPAPGRSSCEGSLGRRGSLLPRSPLLGNPLGSICWGRGLGRRRRVSDPALSSGPSHASGGRGCRVKWRGEHRPAPGRSAQSGEPWSGGNNISGSPGTGWL